MIPHEHECVRTRLTFVVLLQAQLIKGTGSFRLFFFSPSSGKRIVHHSFIFLSPFRARLRRERVLALAIAGWIAWGSSVKRPRDTNTLSAAVALFDC